jgi:hypothetical protein
MIEMLVKEGKPPVKFYTVAEMAKKCGKSKHTFYKYVERGTMPDANYRKPANEIKRGERAGGMIEGERLYSVDILAPLLIKIFKDKKKVLRGRAISIETKQELFAAYAEEKDYYKNKY